MKYIANDEFAVRYMAEHRDEMIRDIRTLVAIDSAKGEAAPGAPFGPGPRKALDAALEIGRRMGFSVRDIDGYCGEITWEAGEEKVAALCHLDIVPIGEGWTRDPLGKSPMEGSLLYGRGSEDNKGPAMATLYALAALKASGYQPKRTLQLIVGCDEECGMSDMVEYLKRVSAPKYAFSPDAGFPAVHGEKGFVKGTFTYTYREPSAVKELYAGIQVNVVPHHAYAVLQGMQAASMPPAPYITVTQEGEDVRIAALGEPAHAADPGNGRNAIGLLMQYLALVLPMGDGALPGIGYIAQSLGTAYDGAGVGVACSDAVSGALTLNVGILRGDAASLTIRIDIRNPVTCDQVKNAEILQASFHKAGFTGEATSQPPLYLPLDHPLVKALHDVYTTVTGDTRPPVTMGGGTYARALPCAVAYGPGMPGYGGGGAHGADERVDIDMLQKAGQVYFHAFAALSEL